jgi:hypothetical protein
LLSLLASALFLLRSRQDAALRAIAGRKFAQVMATVILIALIYKAFVSQSWAAVAVGLAALSAEIALIWRWASVR